MQRAISRYVVILLAVAISAAVAVTLRAQDQFQFETPLDARRRVFEDVGAGFRAIHRGPNGNYYILTAPATAIQIYDAAGTRVGQIPNEAAATAQGTGLLFGESFDVDSEGRIAVSDGLANAVKIYSPAGTLTSSIHVTGAATVALLSGGEMAIASPNTQYLVTVYDLAGKVAREYGDREEISERADVNNQVNFGHLVADDSGNTYFAFDYLPEPTVRKFDRVGYLTQEMSLATLEFHSAAQAARRAMNSSERATPALHRIINGIGVDPQTQDVWVAIGTLLMHFDKDGNRLASYRTYTRSGARLEASSILVEKDRLLIGADPQGIYEFPRPDKHQ